ncbi:DUF6660 family protein [Flavobacterium sp. NKUCC04_CG]|uniref:DUF6660 family protein n=1 Tax=Flavobacterium sp. NKUCC04_CG TaxID=2842121 RepID=UPI00351CF92E
MKNGRQIIIVAISVLMLVLALLPCADRNSLISANSPLTHVAAVPDQHSGMDMCSPFCVCNCCTSPILIKNVFLFEAVSLPKISLKTFDYYQSFITTVLHFIWKPPRIVYFN